MTIIPDSLVDQVYVRGSLQNSDAGCELQLQNRIESATVIRLSGIEIDGRALSPGQVLAVTPDGTVRPAPGVTAEAPLPFPAGSTVTLRLPTLSLGPGRHTVKICLQTAEMGEVILEVTDGAPARGVEPAAAAGPSCASMRPVKIAILGAGSTVFARQLITDLLCTPGLDQGTFALVDIDAPRLELAHHVADRLVESSGRAWTIEASIDRTRVLAGCDYVINTIEVAGLRSVRHDYDIPLKYGVDQCIGDTIGPGGIFKMLRTGPAWLDILRDVERLCPKAVVLNYTNPMSALTLLALRATSLAVVGLCHSVQGTSRQLAGYLRIPYEEMRFRCAGINHLAWFTELAWNGQDMYPRLREAAADPQTYESDPVRFEMMLHLGAFVTESSGHFSEYVPYFRKRPDLLARYTRSGYRGESGFYANNWPQWRARAEDSTRAMVDDPEGPTLKRSLEYASVIIEAIESRQPAVIYGNVLNSGLIDNLPSGGCVEVPVLVDGNGLHPTHFGPLPPQLAALDAAHMYVHELMVRAVLERDREAAAHALMLDPLTAAVCSPLEVRQMFDELWEAERAELGLFEG